MQFRLTPRIARSDRHGGTVLIVVLALLAALTFLGFFFYSWTDSEATAAKQFTEAPDAETDPDKVIEHALVQIIVSTPAEYQQSPLYSGQVGPAGNKVGISLISMLANTIGPISHDGRPLNVNPHSGRGITVVATADNNMDLIPDAMTGMQVAIDYDGDGVADADGTDGANGFVLNFSTVHRDPMTMMVTPFDHGTAPLFEPDAGYTYPDINSLFLAYDGTIVTGAGGAITRRIIIPSFMRPQMMLDMRDMEGDFGNIYISTNANSGAQSLRPHREHYNSDGMTRRYLTAAATQAQSGGDPQRIIGPFPMQVDVDGDTNFNEMGIFTSTGGGVSNVYELDVDADGDGVLDSIWLDLDHPIIDLPDGRQAVPMFYVKIIDADALLNTNFHGQDPLFTQLSNNSSANVHDNVYEIANTISIHASNLGMSPAEVNILPALVADPTNANYIPAADVGRATQPHRGLLADRSGANPIDRTNDGNGQDGFTQPIIAMLELHMLLHGNAEYTTSGGNDLHYRSPSPGDVIPGRYGEPAFIKPALATPSSGVFASAGNTFFDDDGDDNDPTNNIPASSPINNYAGGIRYPDDLSGIVRQNPATAMPILPPPPAPQLIIPAFVHPLDFTGLGASNVPGLFGSIFTTTNPNGGVRFLRGKQSTAPINPSRWLYYGQFVTGTGYVPSAWQMQDIFPMPDPITGVRPWTQAGVPPDWLQDPNVSFDGLFNEADELVATANFPTSVDAPFPPSELSGLHLTDSEWRQTGETSRLRKLMPFNLESNRIASLIRGQFTTDSRDRLEHGYQRSSLAGTNRAWEFNDVLTGNNRFPPAFGPGGGITSRHDLIDPMNPPPPIHPQDPFRPVVRRLLTVEEDNTGNIARSRLLPGQRLDINRLLVHFDEFGNPIYRRLTPHAVFDGTETDGNRYLDDGTGMGNYRPLQHDHRPHANYFYRPGQPVAVLEPDLVDTTATFTDVPYADVSSNLFAREAWARQDRQNLARDIYVLLYTLGGGQDNVDYSTQPYPNTADANMNGVDDFIETIAQFAVNYVDALDQDDVITRFEYDTNLSDGWNTPNAIAFGIESQSLVFSEAMLIRAARGTNDFAVTLHQESPDSTFVENQFLFMELRNASPFPVQFRTGTWRIVREDVVGTTAAAVELIEKAPGDFKQVAAGDNFHIACHDGTVVNAGGMAIPSDFYADIANASELEALVPEDTAFTVPDNNAQPSPRSDLDLGIAGLAAPDDHENYRNFTMQYNGVGTLVEPVAAAGTPVPQFDLVLQRRLNLNGAGFGEGPNTWIEVDRITLMSTDQFMLGSDDQAGVQTEMSQIASVERRQPFDEDANDSTRMGNLRHTMFSAAPNKHAANQRWLDYAMNTLMNPTAGFDLWQPHFNRDFSSIYELLSVPLVRPAQLVAGLADTVGPAAKMTGWADSTMPEAYQPFAAAGLFRHPNGNFDNSPLIDMTNEMPFQNHWYRLFEFITTKPRTHESIRNFEMARRNEAQINLNTLRHESVLAGLIDDPIHLDFFNPMNRATDDIKDMAMPYRNWYDQLRIARDGLDPITRAAGLTMPDLSMGLALPGVPGSMPFRPMSYVDPQGPLGPGSPDTNLQNTLLRDHLQGPGFSLFEARSTNDLQPMNNNVDFHSKNRLLAKIANNTTNRSHVFMIWVGYELFEADHQPGNRDIVRIGSRIENVPGRREFVVVDMSRLEEAYNPDSQRFDFRKFIIHRRRIR